MIYLIFLSLPLVTEAGVTTCPQAAAAAGAIPETRSAGTIPEHSTTGATPENSTAGAFQENYCTAAATATETPRTTTRAGV